MTRTWRLFPARDIELRFSRPAVWLGPHIPTFAGVEPAKRGAAEPTFGNADADGGAGYGAGRHFSGRGGISKLVVDVLEPAHIDRVQGRTRVAKLFIKTT